MEGKLTLGALALLLMVWMTAPAQAYLDPSTLNALPQIMFFIFYSCLAFVALWFRRIKAFFAGIKNRIFRPKS